MIVLCPIDFGWGARWIGKKRRSKVRVGGAWERSTPTQQSTVLACPAACRVASRKTGGCDSRRGWGSTDRVLSRHLSVAPTDIKKGQVPSAARPRASTDSRHSASFLPTARGCFTGRRSRQITDRGLSGAERRGARPCGRRRCAAARRNARRARGARRELRKLPARLRTRASRRRRPR